jgi:hypothetical protein
VEPALADMAKGFSGGAKELFKEIQKGKREYAEKKK